MANVYEKFNYSRLRSDKALGNVWKSDNKFVLGGTLLWSNEMCVALQ